MQKIFLTTSFFGFILNTDLYRDVFCDSDIISFRFTTILTTVTSHNQLDIKVDFPIFLINLR